MSGTGPVTWLSSSPGPWKRGRQGVAGHRLAVCTNKTEALEVMKSRIKGISDEEAETIYAALTSGKGGLNKGAKEGLAQALRDVANAPGEVVLPGEWSKAKELIAAGTDIDYQGASGPVEFDAAGDVAGSVVEMKVENGAFVEVGPLS